MTDSLLHDLNFALRLLKKSPAFTIVAILTLALGIGANASIFTLINGLLLRPLAYPHSDRLTEVDMQYKDGPYYGMSLIQFRTYQRHNQSFQYLAAYDMLGSGLNLSTGPSPELLKSRRVSADFFRALGIAPSIGRDFLAEDDRPGAAPVVILSHRIWKNLLQADPGIIGKPVRIGGDSYTVIGITPANFFFSGDTEAWIPIRTAEDPKDRAGAYKVLGRLQPAAALASAQNDLNTLTPSLQQDFPELLGPDYVGASVVTYQSRIVGDVRPFLLLLADAVAFVLLIACSNIASLLLARAVNRRKEIAIRAALGVTPARLFRQLLTESLLLSLAGGVAGLLFTHWGTRLFLALSTTDLPNAPSVAIDFRVLLFTLVLSVIAGLIFGTAPALQLGKMNSADILRESGRATASVATRRMQGFLVSLEICLATVLLLGAGLLLTSLTKLLRVNPGFDPNHVLTLKTSLVDPAFASAVRVDNTVRGVVTRLQSIPGVQSVAAASMLPTEPSVQLPFELPSLPPDERPSPDDKVQWRAISPDYFELMSIPVRHGRAISLSDSNAAASIAVINQSFAQKYFLHRDPTTQTIVIGRHEGPQFADNSRQIVGVVADTHELGLNQPPAPSVFIPIAQVPDSLTGFVNSVMPMNWLIRTSGEPLAISRRIHQEFLAVNPDLITSDPRSLTQVLGASLEQQKTQTALIGFFSAAALLLGAIGLYGVLAYSVAQRRQEIGIRMALGANRANVLRLIVLHGLKLTTAGIAAGIIIGLLVTRYLSAQLFNLSPNDPATYFAVAALLLLVSLAATAIPARRASQLDPLTCLRHD
jgi:putative ABC transport system permease protein